MQENQQAVFDKASQLNLAGCQLTIIKNYQKYPYYNDWQNIHGVPEEGMTGVGIVGGSFVASKNAYVYIIDLDIYQQEKRDKVYQEIMALFGTKEVHVHTTTSGGYHIIFFCKDKIKGLKKNKFGGFKHRDIVEFFYKGQCLVAPSLAYKKDKITIGFYKKLSKVDILDAAILAPEELRSFLDSLKRMSQQYDSKEFYHNHVTTPEHRKELVRLYHELKALGFRCAPLYGGNRYNKNLDWDKVRDEDFNSLLLTGIVIRLGKQRDGSYLVCLDFDMVSNESAQKIMNYIGESALIERSVSGGYHVFIRTKTKLNINVKWKFPDKAGKLDVLWMDDHTVNIAPTCSYDNRIKSAEPVYKISERLSGSFDSIGFTDEKNLKKTINKLIPYRKLIPGTVFQQSNSEENKRMLQNIRQYGEVHEIDHQIKLAIPSILDLLDNLKIKRSSYTSPDYVRFFSLYAYDGHNPDAILFHNNNNSKKNKWPGYSVKDYHSGEMISFAKYLCKYSPPKFVKLMDMIGFGKSKFKAPISTVFSGDCITLKCGSYISEDQHLEVLNAINDMIEKKEPGHQAKIVITAPTGCGKTEMFYHLAEQKKIQMILALAYVAQVEQGKERHTVPGVLEGLCGNDHDVPGSGSLFITYDKAKILRNKIIPEYYILVIDEAHNIVNQTMFRKYQMRNMMELGSNCKAVVLLTATPDYINYRDIDLMIKIEQEKPENNLATVVKYKEEIKTVLPNVILKQHLPGHVDIVYIRSKKTLADIEKIINSRCSDLKTHVLNAEVKGESDIYDSLSKHQRLSESTVCSTCDILFTTNLIVDGVNINDINIGNVYLVDPASTTDLVQYPARFRNGYQNYFIFITGNQEEYGNKTYTRQELVERYFNAAYVQKNSYEHVSPLLMGYGVVGNGDGDYRIQLVEQYDLLDDQGCISESLVLFKVQNSEAMRMRWDVVFLKEYLEKSDFGYNFQITERKLENVMENFITKDVIDGITESMHDEKLINETVVKKIIVEKEYESARDQLIMDYLKSKNGMFPVLIDRYGIDGHIKTEKFKRFLDDSKCMKILLRYCTGLEIGASNPADMIDLTEMERKSLKRTLNNLRNEAVVNTQDNEYYRFVTVRDWIRKLKNESGKKVVEIDSDQIKEYLLEIKDMKLYIGNKIDIFVQDLKDIFDVETKYKTYKTVYFVGDEWSMKNIRGITFAESPRTPQHT